MKVWGIILVVLLLLCALVGGTGWYVMNKVKNGDLSFMSYFSFLNKVTSTDLGITFTQKDIADVHQSIGSMAYAVTADSPECKNMPCIVDSTIYIGTQKVDTTLTNTQGTALINEWIELSPNAPFTAAQMRVNSDGSVDFAGIVDMQQVKKFGKASKIPADTMQLITKYGGSLGQTFPIKASGTLTIKNNVVDANFSSVQVGIVSIPSGILSQYKEDVNSFLNDRLKVVEGLSIDELSFAGGKTTFKGTVPKTIYFVK